MPDFAYKGFDQSGTEEQGIIDASSEQMAYETLAARGLVVFQLGEEPESDVRLSWLHRDIAFRSRRISFMEQAEVAILLDSLFMAKLPALEIARVAATVLSQPNIQRVFKRVEIRISEGETFASAFRSEGGEFSPVFSAFLEVGDQSASGTNLLQELSQYLRTQGELWRKIMLALIYPAILFVAAFGLVLFIILYLAPNLEPVFESSNIPPSGTLGALLYLNTFLREQWMLMSIILFPSGFIVLTLLQSSHLRSSTMGLLAYVPVIGPTLLLAQLSRVCHTISLLMRSGLSVSDALKASERMVGEGTSVRQLCERMAIAIQSGQPAEHVLVEFPGLPTIFVELFRIGEATNTLPDALASAAFSMTSEVERRSQRFLALLTPAITLVMGLGIGLIVYAIMGTILEVSEIAF